MRASISQQAYLIKWGQLASTANPNGTLSYPSVRASVTHSDLYQWHLDAQQQLDRMTLLPDEFVESESD